VWEGASYFLVAESVRCEAAVAEIDTGVVLSSSFWQKKLHALKSRLDWHEKNWHGIVLNVKLAGGAIGAVRKLLEAL
jgi:hypothetical protein